MSLPDLANDYLFLAPLIEQRIKDTVANVPVDVCETAAQVLAADKRSQVVMVLWAGDRFDASDRGRAGAGAQQILTQRWLVMLGISSAAPTPDARNTRAGPLLSQLHKALAGWTPQGAYRPFVRANAALQPTFTSNKAVYPLGFEITLNL